MTLPRFWERGFRLSITVRCCFPRFTDLERIVLCGNNAKALPTQGASPMTFRASILYFWLSVLTENWSRLYRSELS